MSSGYRLLSYRDNGGQPQGRWSVIVFIASLQCSAIFPTHHL
jgi:hypothetical protein